MRWALRNFAHNSHTCMSSPLMRRLLGHRVRDERLPKSSGKAEAVRLAANLNVPNLPSLNNSQEAAVRLALTRSLTLIQGPPGTGKTVVSAAIVYHLVNTRSPPLAPNAGPKVLLCAPSNIACDQLAAKVSRCGVAVVRLCSKSYESRLVDADVSKLALHNLVQTMPG